MKSAGPQRVAVVGAGYAGLAAAVALVRAGWPVTLFEANRTAGGRARRVEYRGTALDNGQHLLLGAYAETLTLMREVGVSGSACLRLPLSLEYPAELSLSAPHLPAPWHLLAALLLARGLDLAERLAAIRFARRLRAAGFRVPPGITVADHLARHGQPERVRALIWEPLCVAALNTPAASADAQVFAHVLRDALFRRRADSDLILPAVDLSAFLPDAALAWLVQRGAEIRLGARVLALARQAAGWSVRTAAGARDFDAVVCAAAPFQVPALLAAVPGLEDLRAGLEGLAHEPITTVYLQYDSGPRPRRPMIGLRGRQVQWLFDREAISGSRGLLAAVISASGAQLALDHDVLGTIVHREIVEALGPRPAPAWTKVISEKRATFACIPGVFRPPTETAAAGLVLAGDYVAGEYPATLEGAVRSGLAAARESIHYLVTR